MTAEIVVIHPYLKEAKNKNRLKFRESLALGYLASALRAARYNCDTINAEMHCLDTREVANIVIENHNVKLVGISCKSQRTFKAGIEIARRIKTERPDIHITVGGVLATAADEKVLGLVEHFDSVVRGEGEEAIVELADRVFGDGCLDGMPGLTFRRNGEIIRGPERKRIRDLNQISFPARDDLKAALDTEDGSNASAYIVSSRGCYAACTFCSIHQIYGDRLVVRRDPENVVAEMEEIITTYGVRRFSFVDDIFLTPSARGFRWIDTFCDLLIEKDLKVNFYAEVRADTVSQPLLKKLRRAGMHRVFIGFEAGVDSVLERWAKDTKVSDNDKAIKDLLESEFEFYQINMGYIMFDPEMTYSELKQQYYWLKNTGLAKVQHLQNKMNIYWGTPHYERMVSQGRIDDSAFGDRWIYDCDDSRVNFVEKLVRHFHLAFDRDFSEALLNSKERFRIYVGAHEDLAADKIPPWQSVLIGQIHRRLEQLERSLYFYAFEHAFHYIEHGGDVGVAALGEAFRAFWDLALPKLQQIDREARYFSALMCNLERISLRDGAAAQGSPEAWELIEAPDAGSLELSISCGELVTYRITPIAKARDRYDHGCEIHIRGFADPLPERLPPFDVQSALGTSGFQVEVATDGMVM